METLLESISCNIHGKKSIAVESKKFQIFCKSCFINNPDLSTKNLVNRNDIKNEEIKTCFKHSTEEALFYCDDCSEFICKNCFATEHRNHLSSTPELIVAPIKEKLNKSLNELNSLKKTVEESVNSMQELNNYFVNHKTNFKNTVKDISERIGKNLTNKSKEFNLEIENIFNGIDFEVENSTQRLENNKIKSNKMLNQLQSMLKEIDSMKSDKKVCLYKKENDEILNQNRKFFSDLSYFLKENFEKTKDKSKHEMGTKWTTFQRNVRNFSVT
jgi:hypothetical protein